MYNCVAVIRNGETIAYFKTEDAAEMYRHLLMQAFGHLDITIHLDWCYVDGLTF